MAADKKSADKKSSKSSKSSGAKKGGGKGDTIEGRAEEVKKKKSVSPYAFLMQVRTEGEKVSWTSWKETWISTLMVLTMVVVMAIFFLLVDQALRFAVCTGLQLQCVAPTQ